MNILGLFDYDGFICKAFYASIARNEGELEQIEQVLIDLTKSATDKVRKLKEDKSDKVIVRLFASGHTYKKDIYPSYKAHRKKDEYLGVFREYILDKYKDKIIRIDQLEADDVITMEYQKALQEGDYPIVISDDKDLRYYNPFYCKINITEEPSYEDDWENKILEQMLIGDKEDGITGIPKVGEKTAEKLLRLKGYTLSSVIQIYKEHDISIDDCLKNLILVTPITPEFVEDYQVGLDDKTIMNNIIGHFKFFNNKVKEVYFESQEQ